MKFDFLPLRNWFGYTRRERRSSFILLILIFSVISVRFLVPGRSIPLEYINLVQDDPVTDSIKDGFFPKNNEPLIKKYTARENKHKVIDINRCDTSELIRLPGIGPVLSLRIIKYRNLLGGYYSRDQLKEVYGLSAETYEKIKDRIMADTLLIIHVKINSADYRQLSRIPYFERADINAILKYRELTDKIRTASELAENKVISGEKAEKVRPYLSFD